MTHSKTPWSSRLSGKGVEIVDFSGNVIGFFLDPRDADRMLASLQNPTASQDEDTIEDLKDKLKFANDDARRWENDAANQEAKIKELEQENLKLRGQLAVITLSKSHAES